MNEQERRQWVGGALLQTIAQIYQSQQSTQVLDPNTIDAEWVSDWLGNDWGEYYQNSLSSVFSKPNQDLESDPTPNSKANSSAELWSIFSCISFNSSPKPPQIYQPACSFTPHGYALPYSKNSSTADEEVAEPPLISGQANEVSAWKWFQEDLKCIQDEVNLGSLLFFCKKYLWCVPVSESLPDVSVYEYARLKAARKFCEYRWGEERSQQAISDSEECYLLISGDLSGIQNYIYNIGHRGASKALKGRSFYLQQILESIAFSLLKALDLPETNLLFVSGGKFLLLAPNVQRILECDETQHALSGKLKDFRQDMNRRLFKAYESELSLILGWVSLSQKDLESSEGWLQKWQALVAHTTQQKYQKFIDQIEEPESSFFNKFGEWGDNLLCAATQRDLCQRNELAKVIPYKQKKSDPLFWEFDLGKKKVYLDAAQIPDDGLSVSSDIPYISAEQYNAQRFGFYLRHQQLRLYLIETTKLADGVTQNKAYRQFPIMDGNEQLWMDPRYSSKPSELPTLRNADQAILLNEADWGALKHVEKTAFCDFRFYGGDWLPSRNSSEEHSQTESIPLSYEEIAENAKGIPRLGVLRMDVDNLGLTFNQGLQEHFNLTRLVQLSSMLNFFFAGYLNRLKTYTWDVQAGILEPSEANNATDDESSSQKESNPQKSRSKETCALENALQIVYAGGDDLFIIGEWQVLPDVALWIREEFRRFTGNALTLSAGISLFPAKYPIYKAAEAAGEAEERAKQFRKQKDGICFLDTPMSWEDFAEIRDHKNQLYTAIHSDHVGRSLLQRLQQLHQDYETQVQHYQEAFLKESRQAAKQEETSRSDSLAKAKERAKYTRWRWMACYHLARMGKQYKKAGSYLKELAAQLSGTGSSTEQDLIALIHVSARWVELLTRSEVKESRDD